MNIFNIDYSHMFWYMREYMWVRQFDKLNKTIKFEEAPFCHLMAGLCVSRSNIPEPSRAFDEVTLATATILFQGANRSDRRHEYKKWHLPSEGLYETSYCSLQAEGNYTFLAPGIIIRRHPLARSNSYLRHPIISMFVL